MSDTRIHSRILIVEDDPSIRDAMKILFEICRIEAEWAISAEHALALLDRYAVPPTLVLVDGRLPDMHGLQLISILRQRMPASAQIYFFSADAEIENIREIAKVDGVIPKPFDSDVVLALAEKHSRAAPVQ